MDVDAGICGQRALWTESLAASAGSGVRGDLLAVEVAEPRAGRQPRRATDRLAFLLISRAACW
jgi:hypothetical protein